VNGTFLLANPAFQRRHGFTEAGIVGRTSEDLFGHEVARRQAESDRQAMQTDAPVTYENHEFDAEGELRFTEVAKMAMRDEDGRLLGLLGIARDITRRKQEESALIRAKEEAQSANEELATVNEELHHRNAELARVNNDLINLLTGVVFLTGLPAQYAHNPLWWFKVGFIMLAGLNALVYETTLSAKVLALESGADTPTSVKMIGLVSLVAWLAVLYCGRMLPFLGDAF
jgi:PAS domain S-box-containing protein